MTKASKMARSRHFRKNFMNLQADRSSGKRKITMSLLLPSWALSRAVQDNTQIETKCQIGLS